MALTVSSRFEDGFAVLELSGTLTLGPTLVLLRDAARPALAHNKIEGLLLHVVGITMVDSSGLGELTVVYSISSKRQCKACLVEPNASLQRMLEMTRIDELLPSFSSIAAAKKALRGQGAGQA